MTSLMNHDDALPNGIVHPRIWSDGPKALPSIPNNAPSIEPTKIGWSLRVALIDDRLLLREAFAKGLEAAHDGISTVCFSTAAEWESVANQYSDISVVLFCRSGRKIATSHDEIKTLSAGQVPVILVSDAEDADEIRAMIGLGAKGFIPECVELRLAVAAMYLVRAGGVYLPETILHTPQPAVSDANGTGKSPLQALFTERQAAVVEALRQGKPNKIIAYELNMRESTVKVHIRNVMTKLKAKNRTEVAFLTNMLCRNGSS
jgi:DNA-binding NarL/FixJ family response regulator